MTYAERTAEALNRLEPHAQAIRDEVAAAKAELKRLDQERGR